jgi:uncharacterized protein
VARVDAKADRAGSVLRVPALHLEPGGGAPEVHLVHRELHELAGWLGLDDVAVERTLR